MQTTDCSGTRSNCGFDWLRNSQSLVTMPILIFYMHSWRVFIAYDNTFIVHCNMLRMYRQTHYEATLTQPIILNITIGICINC